MLIRYKKTFEKIAMGLLSFMPSEKDLKRLLQTIKQYETEEKWQLFLWKVDEDIIGLLGGVWVDNQTFQIQHISVNPSHRQLGVGKNMVKACKELFPENEVTANDTIKAFLNKCDREEADS
ncbi:GNAT family N-acetyltransferase [Bacillus benzoevorans]|uniref:Riboflavin biosynthesis RibT protein n=1 Tax=Bacillus benzoevorans TaxID=1456 RepID=A0A7X0HS87_9BACI|nr:GNAT family N-acetyltransferase [Bacillus benzoevorans]MBB6444755.1 riboflavin biosynthesis RibT protein [Bacillus benzoevorans]